MGKGNRHYDSNKAGVVNIDMTYNYFMYRLMSIAISCFKWYGLPDTVDERFLEMILVTEGMAVFFNDDVMGNLAARVMIDGTWDIYDIPWYRIAYANNGYMRELNNDNSVLIYDNMLHSNLMPMLSMFCQKLTNVEVTKDINLRAQKTPILILCDDEERLSMENLYMKVDCGVPVIYGTKKLILDNIKVLKTDAPYLVDKLHNEKMNVLYEAFSFLGIGSMDFEKKANLVVDEVQISQDANIAQRTSRLKERQLCAKKINDMFYNGNEQVYVEFNNEAVIEARRLIQVIGNEGERARMFLNNIREGDISE